MLILFLPAENVSQQKSLNSKKKKNENTQRVQIGRFHQFFVSIVIRPWTEYLTDQTLKSAQIPTFLQSILT